MKKILFILPNIAGGGAERVGLTFLKRLDPNKYQRTLLLLREEGNYWNLIPPDIRVVIAVKSGRLLYRLPKILKTALREAKNHDILIGGLELLSSYLTWICGNLTGKRVWGMVHCLMKDYIQNVTFLRRIVAWLFYRRMKNLIFVSHAAADSMAQWLGFQHTLPSWRVIYNLFDPESYDQNGETILQEDYPIILSMGRMDKGKGFDVLIRAFAGLSRIGFPHRLVILGEGPQRAALQQLADELEISEKIEMPGFVPNPMDYLKKADVFVLSARHESFGMVLIEAMYAGIPVVSTDCAGPAEVLDQGQYGVLVAKENPSALTEGIRKLLEDPVLYQHYKQTGQKRVQDFFYPNIMKQWERLLEGDEK